MHGQGDKLNSVCNWGNKVNKFNFNAIFAMKLVVQFWHDLVYQIERLTVENHVGQIIILPVGNCLKVKAGMIPHG